VRIVIISILILLIMIGLAGGTAFLLLGTGESGGAAGKSARAFIHSTKTFYSISDAAYACEQKLKAQFADKRLTYDYVDQPSYFSEENNDFYVYYNINVESKPGAEEREKFFASYTCNVDAKTGKITRSEMQSEDLL